MIIADGIKWKTTAKIHEVKMHKQTGEQSEETNKETTNWQRQWGAHVLQYTLEGKLTRHMLNYKEYS